MHGCNGILHGVMRTEQPSEFANSFRVRIFDQGRYSGARFAYYPKLFDPVLEDLSMNAMNLWVWLPALFVAGTMAMAALFAFVLGCEKV